MQVDPPELHGLRDTANHTRTSQVPRTQAGEVVCSRRSAGLRGGDGEDRGQVGTAQSRKTWPLSGSWDPGRSWWAKLICHFRPYLPVSLREALTWTKANPETSPPRAGGGRDPLCENWGGVLALAAWTPEGPGQNRALGMKEVGRALPCRRPLCCRLQRTARGRSVPADAPETACLLSRSP